MPKAGRQNRHTPLQFTAASPDSVIFYRKQGCSVALYR